MLKTITTGRWLSDAAAGLLTLLVRFAVWSIRWRCIDKGGLRHILDKHGGDGDGDGDGNGDGKDAPGVILVNWHSRTLGFAVVPGRHFPLHYLSSPSRDGRFVARIIRHFNYVTIWGSSSKKALSGFRAMLRALGEGRHVGLTPDGPRGPARKAAKGVVALAQRSGAVIVPVAFSARRMHRLRTWDRMVVPLPFTHGVTYWGAPLAIPADADADAARRLLEDALNTACAEADAACGHMEADHIPHRYGAAQKSHRDAMAAKKEGGD